MIPIVMSGGSGTRLWPMSRELYPKQFCDFLGESLQIKTVKRLKEIGEPWILTVESLRVITERFLKDENLPTDKIIYEPFPKNTAPAIALLCKYLSERGFDDEVVSIFPADHLIAKESEFYKSIKLAEIGAKENRIVTLGIRPNYAATGYGYIEADTTKILGKASGLTSFAATAFHEKPSHELAAEYIKEGRYFWNAGIFVFKVRNMIDMFKTHLPEAWFTMDGLNKDGSNLKEIYESMPAISIDYGIMEKIDNIEVIPCDIGWSDVGSWDEVANVFEGNTGSSQVRLYESNADQNFVYSGKKKLVALVDVKNLVVVDTEDALLICKRNQSQSIKSVVAKMKSAGEKSVSEHMFDIRPWGSYKVLEDETDFKLKRIKVEPGERISYQSHKNREELWVIVRGEAKVTLDEVDTFLKPGDRMHIPKEAKHRIENIGNLRVEFIEVQTGTYFGEDDITRFSDDYGRV